MDLELTDRVAVVTGASKGIGLAITRTLLAEGASVVATSRRSTPELDALAGPALLHIPADLMDPDAPAQVMARAAEAFGGVDILVNNAGVLTRIRFLDLPEEEWRRVLRTNLDGYFLVGQAVARQMVASGQGGVIVNVTSVNQSVVGPNLTHYSTSKAGAWMLTRQMAYELAPHGIRVNALAPGMTVTDLNRADVADPAFREQRLSRIPLGFMAEPADHVGALLYLVSDEARFVTGTCITVDGGADLLGPASLFPG